MSEIIKIKTDSEFERLGRQYWWDFKTRLEAIKREYDVFGEEVLDRRLKDESKIYKDAFESENFIQEIRKIWRQEHHYIIESLDELIAYYELYTQNEIDKEEMPSMNKYRYWGRTKGVDDTFAISMELSAYIEKKAKIHNNKICLLKENKVYQLSIQELSEDNTDFCISMKKIEAIEED